MRSGAHDYTHEGGLKATIGTYLDTSFLLVVALVATVAFLLWKERLRRPMWLVRSAILSLLLWVLGGSVAEAAGLGIIGGLLWEILNELSGQRQRQ